MIVQTALISSSCCVDCRMAYTTVGLVVGLEVGRQNIGPTSIIISCDLIDS